jgi:MFS superfamily sulfate permease-like transporter
MTRIKPKIILTGMVISMVLALFDIMAGIYTAVLTNTFCNYVVISRQKSKVTVKRVKKERSMTADEFREREIAANPHRDYPSQ